MGDEDWEGIREEHRAIAETMREYLGTLATARELIDSSLGQMERSRMLLSRYYRMRELAHLADVQIARAGEALMLDMVRNNGKPERHRRLALYLITSDEPCAAKSSALLRKGVDRLR